MDTNAIQALRPHQVIELKSGLSEDQVLQKIKDADNLAFILPRAPFLDPDKLAKFVDAGALLIFQKEDIKRQLYPRSFMDQTMHRFKEKVFIKGYSHFSSKSFLEKGASLLIDGALPLGGLTPEKVKDLCDRIKDASLIKVSPHDYLKVNQLKLASLGVRMVFCCFDDMQCDQQLVKDCIQVGKKNMVVVASSYSQQELAGFLDKGACVLIRGADKLPINAIQALALDQSSQADPQKRNLKVIPDQELANHIVTLEQLVQDQKIELLSDYQLLFNNSSNSPIYA